MSLVRLGGIVTAVGLVLTVIAMIPLLVPSVQMPSAWWFLSMVTGVGLGLMCLGFWRAARERSQSVAREIEVGRVEA